MSTTTTEALKAAVITVLGLAMVIAPSIGDEGAEDYWTIPRMLAWAWSRPLGVVFTAVGLLGLYAVLVVAGRRPAATP